LFAVVLLAQFFSPDASGADQQWGAKLSVPNFNRAVERILAAALEEQPFVSLKGQDQNFPSGPAWQPLVPLPGASLCSILPANPERTRLSYNCWASYKSPTQAQKGYQTVIGLLSEATKRHAEPRDLFKRDVSAVVLSGSQDGKAGKGQPIIDVSQSNDNAVFVSFFAAVRQPISAPPAASLVVSMLQQVAAAANEQTPFGSLVAGLKSQTNVTTSEWHSRLALPGATTCVVKFAPPPVVSPYYACSWLLGPQAPPFYNDLMKTVGTTGEWTIWNPPSSPAPQQSGPTSAVFRHSTGPAADVWLILDGETVTLSVNRPRTAVRPGTTIASPSSSPAMTGPKWGEGSIVVPSFEAPLRQVLNSAAQQKPFDSIKRDLLRPTSSTDQPIYRVWTAAVDLHGAVGCQIVENQRDTLGGKWVGRQTWYSCTNIYASPDAAQAAFKQVRSLISSVTGWSMLDNPSGADVLDSVRIAGTVPDAANATVSLTRANSVSVLVFAEGDERRRASSITPQLMVDVLHRILAAAHEAVPFRSITGQPFELAGSKQWFATEAVPEANSCSIVFTSNTLNIAGYRCLFPPRRGLKLDDVYQDLARIMTSTGDWVEPKKMSAEMTWFDDRQGVQAMLVMLRPNYVMLDVQRFYSNPRAPQTVPPVTISSNSEGVTPIPSGGYSPLPPPQRSADSRLGASTVRYVAENRTAYELHLRLTGPVSQEFRVLPGATQTQLLPAGSYMVVGDVASGAVLPFYGRQTYEGAAEYRSVFYTAPR